MNRSILLVLLAAASLSSLASAGSIYKCTVAGGGTVFSQVPCGEGSAQVAGSGAKKPADPGADAQRDKATLAQIDDRCSTKSHQVTDGYAARFAEANAEIAGLHKHLMIAGTSEKDPAVQKQISAVEASKTELLGTQDRELSVINNQCQLDRTTELKRQADRDGSRAVAKR